MQAEKSKICLAKMAITKLTDGATGKSKAPGRFKGVKNLLFRCCGKAESFMASELFDKWVRGLDKKVLQTKPKGCITYRQLSLTSISKTVINCLTVLFSQKNNVSSSTHGLNQVLNQGCAKSFSRHFSL